MTTVPLSAVVENYCLSFCTWKTYSSTSTKEFQ